jgi:uncharacterized protein YbaA (DUF1428 family)
MYFSGFGYILNLKPVASAAHLERFHPFVSIPGSFIRRGKEAPILGTLHSLERKEKTMSYIDGFVIAVPTANKEKFIAHADNFDTMFLEFGATRILECWGDDVPDGTVTDFRKAVQAKDDETVVFSWVEWPDKATRDSGMKRMMEDPRMDAANPMPFDGKRMIYGGFAPVVEVKK